MECVPLLVPVPVPTKTADGSTVRSNILINAGNHNINKFTTYFKIKRIIMKSFMI